MISVPVENEREKRERESDRARAREREREKEKEKKKKKKPVSIVHSRPGLTPDTSVKEHTHRNTDDPLPKSTLL